MEKLTVFLSRCINTSHSVLIVVALLCLSMNSWAQKDLTEIEFVKADNRTNQISYFDNRFRLDAQLDEVTFVFYRVSGAAPVILVRPDGTKIKVNQHDKERISWFEDTTFDMVKIKAPMPGPWQVIGKVLPNSKIMVVTDVNIEVDPLPSLILSGETLKLKAKFFNGDKAIKAVDFRDVVQLNVEFFSSNNALYDNFAAGSFKLTSFLDDGRGLDEYPKDNIFTGEFKLTMSPGEWIPEYFIIIPTLERKVTQEPIILRPSPVKIDVMTSETVDEKHQLTLTIDDTYVESNSLLFQGKMFYPNQDPVSFSLIEAKNTRELKKRTVEFDNIDTGVHRIEVSVFGETKTGREFQLVLPEYSFNVAAPEIVSVEEAAMKMMSEDDKVMEEIRQQAIEAERKLEELKAQQKIEQEERDAKKMMMIIIGNSVLFLIAIIGFLVYFLMKKRQQKKAVELPE